MPSIPRANVAFVDCVSILEHLLSGHAQAGHCKLLPHLLYGFK